MAIIGDFNCQDKDWGRPGQRLKADVTYISRQHGDLITDSEGKAEIFVNQFQSVFTMDDINQQTPQLTRRVNDNIHPLHQLLSPRCNTSHYGHLPKHRRDANIAPIFTNGVCHYSPDNYRPVSLTCVLSELLEHIIYVTSDTAPKAAGKPHTKRSSVLNRSMGQGNIEKLERINVLVQGMAVVAAWHAI
ncbi:hypothetical protein DPMN_061282 [Dreissena polymorpha]|uniref:Endonuclease/exonuclease/phosphatase domain-containing protein n=1 Tax=Dreissena polymorpha TaxID=45954 RepID=A0A9D4C6Q5_DREPO|nr:hypothetical protein DPMN_061282 [Dreissena polymorpha]